MTTIEPVPRPAMSFVGREHELRQLLELFSQPSCRLVTLVGAGGSGKTRLALEAARQFADDAGFEAAFVPLDGLDDWRRLPATIAEALNIRLSGSDEPDVQLSRAIGGRRVLLVLDNFEHVMEAAALVSPLIDHASELKVVVTSREALNLREEWRYPVSGLAIPPGGSSARPEEYAAVRLFEERARRVRADFSLDREREHVSEICRLVDGLPLAIELAAAWIRAMRPHEIAGEIAQGLDILSTNKRDVPERHRTMRAVLEESWRLLTDDERSAFRKLAVFRGGFDRDAARQVAGIDATTLVTLIDKSLVTPAAEGRFRMHELLRQYAEERLLEHPREAEEIGERHSGYFAELLKRNLDDENFSPHPSCLEYVARDWENVLAAWSRALARREIDRIGQCARSLELYFQFRSQYADGLHLVRQAWDRLSPLLGKEHADVALRLLNGLAWLSIRVGRVDDAEHWLDVWDDYVEGGEEIPGGLGTDPAAPRAIVAMIRGEYAEAKRLATHALDRSEQSSHRQNKALAYYALANACRALGETDEAKAHAQRAVELSRALDDDWFLAYTLIELGNAVRALGEPAGAVDYYKSAFELRESIGDREGMAVALNDLGTSALQMGQVEQAVKSFRQAVDLYRGLADPGGLSTSLHGLGDAALAADSLATGRDYLREALEVSASIGFVPRILSVLGSSAQLFGRTGTPSRAAEIAAFVMAHPAAQADTAASARHLLASLHKGEPAPTESTLDEMVGAALAGLSAIEPAPRAGQDNDIPSVPLSEREREVLRALAQGLSNREIADQLVVAAGTVKAHTHSIYRKLGAENRVQAIERARELGLLPAF